MSEPKLPSEIEFASFLVYNPRPEAFPSKVSGLSRRIRDAVKLHTAGWAKRQNLGGRMRSGVGEEIRERFLPSHATLVPVPGHAPMKDPQSHWPSRKLCEAFVADGLGARWLPLLERRVAVKKAAFCAPEERPTAEMHYDSFRVTRDLAAGSVITVVDDVLTRGATMLAAVARLSEAFPDSTIRGFALIRTMSDEAIKRVMEPCEGVIQLVRWGTKRIP